MFTHVLALNPSRQLMMKISLADGSLTELITGLAEFPDGIIVDRRRSRIYWTNMGMPDFPSDHLPEHESDFDFHARTGSIEAAALDGSDRTSVLPKGSFVTGKQLAAAWTRKRLYWADREGAAILSAKLDGSDLRTEVVTATGDADRRVVRNQCVGVAVDELNGHLYWTQKGPSDGGDGRIFRTALDLLPGETAAARNSETLWEGLPEPIDLELDLNAGLLYWTDRGAPPAGNTLNRAVIPAPGQQGGPVEILASDFHEAIGLAVDHKAGLAVVGDLGGEIRAVRTEGHFESATVTKIPGGVTGLALI